MDVLDSFPSVNSRERPHGGIINHELRNVSNLSDTIFMESEVLVLEVSEGKSDLFVRLFPCMTLFILNHN